MVLRWIPSLVPALMVISGLSLAETSTQSRVNCTAKRRPEGTTYNLSHSEWSSNCGPNWEAMDGTSLARGSKLHEGMVVELNELSITLKDCQEYLRFKWQCSNVREEVICRVNCSVPIPEELHTPKENVTVKWCLTVNFCLDKLHFGLGLGLAILGPLAAIFTGVCIWKKCTTKRRQEEVEAVQQETVGLRSFSDNQGIQQNEETDKKNDKEFIC